VKNGGVGVDKLLGIVVPVVLVDVVVPAAVVEVSGFGSIVAGSWGWCAVYIDGGQMTTCSYQAVELCL
jgi:hypothetical protein